ncbi:hypothetical protein C8A00DRAFT_13255 [Chaetomidium leptoderma]|uniref:Myb-like domain-containing protein n=1 Tax=Chaetomidium leptoderma TaxID=669021 RepID=A0AAN6VSP1_9PEZI|nr:hypothetical protein C8A00DRAFT_13255 [Chaetomidium leptoderma]
MFISPTKPQVDVVSLRDNVFTFAGAEFAPWFLQLNQINTTLFLNQHRLHDMSFNQMSLKSGWPLPGPKQQETPQHGLPLGGNGYHSETQNTGDSVSLQSTTSNRTSSSSASTYVSQYSTLPESRAVSNPLSANVHVPATPDLLDSSYWPVAPPPDGAPALPPFAHGGDPLWEHAHHAVNPSLLDYSNYTLGVHASVLPQTVFRPGEALHHLSLAPMLEKESSTSSKLYASSDMLEAMVLSDDPSRPSWSSPSGGQAEYEGPRCIDVSESDVTSTTWAGPGSTDEKTVSPSMLRIRQTPTPSSSCESIRTSFLADANANQPLATVAPMPSHTSRSAGPGSTQKARKLLPDRGQRPLFPSSDMSRRQSSAPSSPVSRKLTRLRPKPKLAAGPSLPSPPPASLASPSHYLVGAGPPGECSQTKDRLDFADRVSKDDFLVRQKQMGMTYKEIRRMGGFTEAESTLRGRYRTLTKCRDARVRKPEWLEKDLRLLENGVRDLAHTSDLLNPAKIPWKKVAEYIVRHGGSYHFGNSTCRKRWDELVREQAALGKNVRQPFFGVGYDFGAEVEGGGAMEQVQGYLQRY